MTDLDAQYVKMRTWFCWDCNSDVAYVGKLRDRPACRMCGATFTVPEFRTSQMPMESAATRHKRARWGWGSLPQGPGNS